MDANGVEWEMMVRALIIFSLSIVGGLGAKVPFPSAADYVLSCRKPNGAFGPTGQEYTDAAWNYPALKALRVLGVGLEDPQKVWEQGMGYPEGHVGYGHWLFFHRHGIRELLGGEFEPEHREVQLVHQGDKVNYYGSPFGTDGDTFFKAGGNRLDPRDAGAKALGYYNLSSLHYVLAGLGASGRKAANPDGVVGYILGRRTQGGGFVDLRADGHCLADKEAHLAHTHHAISCLQLIGFRFSNPYKSIQFLQACQTPDGGFRWSPEKSAPGNDADLYYTWCAVSALEQLGARPEDAGKCVRWIQSLQNEDGGFGDKPGWRSRLYSTYYAVEALEMLGWDEKSPKQKKTGTGMSPLRCGGQGLGVFQALMKVPVVDPGDLPGLQARGLDLLGLKSYDFGKAQELQMAARKMDPPMEVVLCPEAYPHRAVWIGGPKFHHIANPTLNPSWCEREQSIWKAADEAGKLGLPWPEYQRQVIRPLRQMGSLVYPEQDFEMEFALAAYDEGLRTGRGYNAVLAGFNWSPRDFVRVFPWRERYVDKLVPVADVDAHGDLKKWSPQLDHCRMLFMATGPGYGEFLEAGRDGRVVCAVLGEDGKVALYGRAAVVAEMRKREREAEWQWWE